MPFTGPVILPEYAYFCRSLTSMSFIFPYMLWGLIAVSIPVIIHLFNFRRFRKVYFTNVRFLEELQQQTQRQSQLRHLLVMILRMLAIAALVIAFAQPFVPLESAVSRPDAVNHVAVYIDNSFSMEALSPGGPLIELARTRAREIADAYRSTDLFMLTTNDFEGKHQRWVSREDFLQMVDEVAVGPTVRTLSEVGRRQLDAAARINGAKVSAFLLSDFQTGMADLHQAVSDSALTVWLVPLEAVRRENLFIDSCWFASPVHQLNQGVKLVTRVVNDSGTDYEKVPLKFSVNGRQKALASFDIRSGTAMEIALPFTNHEAGIQYGVLEITDYPVTFDDRQYIVFDVAGSIPVLCINGQGESLYLNALFLPDSAFRFVNVNSGNIDYSGLQQFGLIILNQLPEVSSGLAQELSVFLDNGGTIFVIPSPAMDLASYQAFLSSAGANFYTGLSRESTRVSSLDLENMLFSDVFENRGAAGKRGFDNTDLPVVSASYGISRTGQTSQVTLMSMLNGKPFLTHESAGKGQVYLLAVPLGESFSNLPRHSVFVPVLYRVALLSAATAPLYYTIGRDNQLDLPNTGLTGDKIMKIRSHEDEFEFIPAQQSLNKKLSLQLQGQVTRAGHFDLVRDGSIIRGLGFNYDRLESVMEFLGEDALNAAVREIGLEQYRILSDSTKPVAETIKDMNQGRRYWQLFIILALFFLGMEIVLLRYWKIKR